jgi:hypothetical protein
MPLAQIYLICLHVSFTGLEDKYIRVKENMYNFIKFEIETLMLQYDKMHVNSVI